MSFLETHKSTGFCFRPKNSYESNQGLQEPGFCLIFQLQRMGNLPHPLEQGRVFQAPASWPWRSSHESGNSKLCVQNHIDFSRAVDSDGDCVLGGDSIPGSQFQSANRHRLCPVGVLRETDPPLDVGDAHERVLDAKRRLAKVRTAEIERRFLRGGLHRLRERTL